MRANAGRCIGAVVALCALLVLPSPAQAFEITNADASPASTDAGANTDLTISFETPDAASDMKDLTVHLPPGLVGNPLATPMCTEAELANDDCDPVTQVGTVTNDLTVTDIVPVPLTVDGDIYNLVPRAGEPARFGIVLRPLMVLPPIILQSGARLRESDLGLDTILNDLPNMSAGMPIHIESTTLTLFGTAGSPPQGFIRLPTSCRTHTVGFDAVAYDAQAASAQAQFTTSNCGALPFTPELSARIKRVGAVNEPVELSTTIAQTIDEAGLLRAQVVLPGDLGGNNATLNNQCTQADFSAGNCPPASIVGSAVATSPLQSQALSGTVALVQPASPGLPDLGIDLRGPLALKLKGTLGFTPDGRNIVVFDNLPDIPIAAFTLTFAAGPGGLVIASRDVCQQPPLVFDANFLAHSAATLATTAAATVDCSGATGGGGNGGQNRKPRAKVNLGRLGSDEPTMKLTVRAGSAKLRTVQAKLPRELALSTGKAFDRGTTVGKVSIKNTARKLKLRAKPAARKLKVKLADGALLPGKGLRSSSRPKFKLKVRDAAGKRTKLTVRGK